MSLALVGSAVGIAWRLVVSPIDADRLDRLVVVRQVDLDGEIRESLTLDEFSEIAASSALESVSAIGYQHATMDAGSLPRRVSLGFVSRDFFQLLGRPAGHGRDFVGSDFLDGAAPVAILSDSFWQNELDGRDDIIGQSIVIGRTDVVVIGIAHRDVIGTRLDYRPAAFLPVPQVRAILPEGHLLAREQVTNYSWLTVAGRLRPVDSLGSAERVLRAWLDERFPSRGSSVALAPLRDVVVPVNSRVELAGSTRLFLIAALGFLLLGATTLAMVTLMHLESRRGELAMRQALGATRWRIGMLVNVDIFVVVLPAVALAFPLARLVIGTASGISLPGDVQVANLDLALDGPAILAIGLAGLLVIALVGMIVGFGIMGYMRTGMSFGHASGATHMVGARLRRGFVTVLMSLVIALLGGAVFATRTASKAMALDLGYEADRVLHVTFALREYEYTPVQIEQFMEALILRVPQSPAVEGASYSYIAGSMLDTAYFDGAQWTVPGFIRFFAVDPSYFETLGLRVIVGRNFVTDDRGEPPVAVISISLAEKLSQVTGLAEPDDVLGRTLFLGPPYGVMTVVGIAEDRVYHPRFPVTMVVYLSTAQHPLPAEIGNLVLILDVEHASESKGAVLNVVRDLDPDVVPVSIETAEEALQSAFVLQHLTAKIMFAFSAVALALMMISLHALVKSVATSKRKEIAIRSALGAGALRTGQWFAMEIGRPVIVGLLCGSAALWVWYDLMSAYIVGLTADDLGLVLIILAVACVLAIGSSVGPAVLSSRRLPADVLRQD